MSIIYCEYSDYLFVLLSNHQYNNIQQIHVMYHRFRFLDCVFRIIHHKIIGIALFKLAYQFFYRHCYALPELFINVSAS